MNLGDEEWACGCLCIAARRMGIYINEEKHASGSSFMFGDLQVGRFISGREKPNRRDALIDACKEFAKYLHGEI